MESCQVGTWGEDALLRTTEDPGSIRAASPHIAEEELEEYSFDRLTEPRLAVVERHLGACARCREALAQVEEFILLVRTGAKKQTPPPQVRPFPYAAWAAVAAAIIVAMGLFLRIESPGAVAIPANVTLVAERGGDAFGIAHAPARRPLNLEIDARGLPPAELRVQIVDARGTEVWESTLPKDAPHPRVERLLAPGLYWVRLYAGRTDLLREFGLQLD